MNKKFSIQINPTVNNRQYIESKFNLARSNNQDIELEVLGFKIVSNNNMKCYDILKREGLDYSPMLSNIEINDIEHFISYVSDFCMKTYQRVKF